MIKFRTDTTTLLQMASSESNIFSKLERLCMSPGYIHALALICFNNETVLGTKAESLPEGAPSYLTNTEFMTLVGLLVKAPISYELPSTEDLTSYVGQSYQLLHELHVAMVNSNPQSTLGEAELVSNVFREPIFYAGDSAYYFQYLDFVVPKYEADAAWLLDNKNVDLSAGRSVCTKLIELHRHRKNELLANQHGDVQELILGAFQYSHDDLRLSRAELDFLEAFTLPHDQSNAGFISVSAFNTVLAYPIIRKNDDEIIVLSHYCLTQSFYESPYYWLLEDKDYRQTAASNRGRATESITADLLERIFSKDNVFKNVEIHGGKGNILGEIDILVVYANHVLILQAKSKRLTLQSRKGHVQALEEDFKNAVRKAANQAFLCAEHVNSHKAELSSPDGRPIPEIGSNSRIFTLTVLLDHYPALSHQTFFLLNLEQRPTDQIASPFVADVFVLDTMTKMLDSPLKFLHYLSQRTRKPKLFQANNEHELIGMYLQGGLAVKEDNNLVLVDENVSYDIDIAMEVKRNNTEGFNLPENLFDKLSDTHFGNMINVLENNPSPMATNLGLALLDAIQCSVPIEDMNRKIDNILRVVARGDDNNIFSFKLLHLSIGVTIMCVPEPTEFYANGLRTICTIRKYENKLSNWFGILLIPSGEFVFACELNEPWRYDPKLESVLNEF